MAGDRPAERDLLGRADLVEALAAMVADTETGDTGGLTVALLGDWGAGKSTMMKLLQQRLDEFDAKRFEFADFNAWRYERTDNIAAGLAQQVVDGLIDRASLKDRLALHAHFAWAEYRGELIRLIVSGIVLVLAFCFWPGPGSPVAGIGVLGAVVAAVVYLLRGLRRVLEHPLASKLWTYLKLPSYGEHLGLIPVLQRHIRTLCRLRLTGKRKLIVFVDDLDRCQHTSISKTLDAIRLVVDVPKVVVVIGIDHRIAFKAMEAHYAKLADEAAGRGAAEIARDYLGKIIQLPVRLLPAGEKDLGQFVHKRLFANVKPELPPPAPEPEPQPAPEAGEKQLTEQENPPPSAKKSDASTGEPTSDEAVRQTSPPPFPPEKPEPDAGPPPRRIPTKEMEEEPWELNLFLRLAGTFEFSNPRQLLRLRNSYRLLKGLGQLQPGEPSREYWKRALVVLFWQEFLHNWSRAVRDLAMAVLWHCAEAEEIELPAVRRVVAAACLLVRERFAPPASDGDQPPRGMDEEGYAEVARFVRMVVLPHSDAGVLDTPAQARAWADRRNS